MALQFELPHRRRRRRPRQPAAGVGGVERRRAGRQCELDHDETGGLNRDGRDRRPRARPSTRCRCSHERARRLAAGPDRRGRRGPADLQLARRSSTASAARPSAARPTASHAELVRNEAVGESDGTPGQVFRTARVPVLLGGAPVVLQSHVRRGLAGLDTRSPTSPTAAPTTATSCSTRCTARSPSARPSAQPDGTTTSYGCGPAARAPQLRMRSYTVGGGRGGNVARARRSTLLRTSIPYVSGVDNRYPAQGGVDGETLEEAKARGPDRAADRAAAPSPPRTTSCSRKQAAPEVARVQVPHRPARAPTPGR